MHCSKSNFRAGESGKFTAARWVSTPRVEEEAAQLAVEVVGQSRSVLRWAGEAAPWEAVALGAVVWEECGWRWEK